MWKHKFPLLFFFQPLLFPTLRGAMGGGGRTGCVCGGRGQLRNLNCLLQSSGFAFLCILCNAAWLQIEIRTYFNVLSVSVQNSPTSFQCNTSCYDGHNVVSNDSFIQQSFKANYLKCRPKLKCFNWNIQRVVFLFF